MKLLHTADWHLNDKLGQFDRTAHLQSRVEEVARICEREAVDVLVIAGDLFSEQAQANSHLNQIAESFRHLRRTFAAFFARGGVVLGVTGNHDQDGRVHPHLELACAGMNIAEPPRGRGDYLDPGKMYLLDTAFIARLRDRQAGFDVQFVLVPFPSMNRLLDGTETASTAGELNRRVAETLAAQLRSLPQWSGYDASLRTVLVAHLNVTGADVGRGMFRISESSDVVLDVTALPSGFDYIALGHVHKAQCIRGLTHIRFSGSLDRMDHGEQGEQKGVVLVDLGPDGRRGEPVFVPIEATPLFDVVVTDPATAPAELAAQVPDPEAALVRVIVEPAATAAGAAVDLAIRAALPNVSGVQWQAPTPVEDAAVPPRLVGGSVREQVFDCIRRQVAEDDPQRAGLLALAGEFLDQEGFR